MVKPIGSFEWGVVLTGTAVIAFLAGWYSSNHGRDASPRAVLTKVAVMEPPVVGVRGASAVVPPEAPVPPPPPPPRHAFTLTAPRGDSWVEVRSGSFGGRVLYEGQLAQGETVRFRSRRIWIRFGAASHLDLFIDGRRARLPAFGTFDAFASARGVRADHAIHSGQ